MTQPWNEQESQMIRSLMWVALLVLSLFPTALVAQPKQVNQLPNPGFSDSLERWMHEAKVDTATREAVRVCERYVVGNARADLNKTLSFEPAWATNCNIIRKKMFDDAMKAHDSRRAKEKALVDELAKRK